MKAMNRARRCFIAAAPDVNTSAVRSVLGRRRLIWNDAVSAPAARFALDTVEASIRDSDFVCALISAHGSNDATLFELGLARGLRKPSLTLLEPEADLPRPLKDLTFVRARFDDES